MASFSVVFALILACAVPAWAFYLPGLAPVNFCKEGDANRDTCKVNRSSIGSILLTRDSCSFLETLHGQDKNGIGLIHALLFLATNH
jgi:hypothetical protein